MASNSNLTASAGGDKRKSYDAAPVYNALVIDSGAIIKCSHYATSIHSIPFLHSAKTFYTVEGVLREIRDSKSRNILEAIPLEIVVREPSTLATQVVARFARLTGDYPNLSSVDLQLLGLQYDLEMEGCGSVQHLRTEPKRMLGLGKIEALGIKNKNDQQSLLPTATATSETDFRFVDNIIVEEKEVDEDDFSENDDEETIEQSDSSDDDNDSAVARSSAPKKTWAMLVNPNTSCMTTPSFMGTENTTTLRHNMEQLNLDSTQQHSYSGEDGQFSDAEEDDLPQVLGGTETLYPANFTSASTMKDEVNDELLTNIDFPSLSATVLVRNRSNDHTVPIESYSTTLNHVAQNKKKVVYNSFRSYKGIVTAKGAGHFKKEQCTEESKTMDLAQSIPPPEVVQNEFQEQTYKSRILGVGAEGQSDEVLEDNGEGWVNVANIASLKATGRTSMGASSTKEGIRMGQRMDAGPPANNRCACATTDFAMQNVILQIGMKLVSVDGNTIRRLKQWVTRCSACFKIFYDGDNNGSKQLRLFCSKCGSDCLERVSASVDGKTGRIILHLSKRNKVKSTRGTKFSLPKPGRANKYGGDVLLREDQLLMGAWHQKVIKGSKTVSSMFGSDISDTVGLGDLTKRDDIQVGFGKRNPNATKFGRERRGKKKKTADKACGLRRY